METLFFGMLFAIGFIWPIHKLPLRVRQRLNQHAFSLDVLVGLLMSYLFLGTATGMIIATIATVLFTAYMSWSTHAIGTRRLLQFKD